jgi:hypothetical protein
MDFFSKVTLSNDSVTVDIRTPHRSLSTRWLCKPSPGVCEGRRDEAWHPSSMESGCLAMRSGRRTVSWPAVRTHGCRSHVIVRVCQGGWCWWCWWSSSFTLEVVVGTRHAGNNLIPRRAQVDPSPCACVGATSACERACMHVYVSCVPRVRAACVCAVRHVGVGKVQRGGLSIAFLSCSKQPCTAVSPTACVRACVCALAGLTLTSRELEMSATVGL